VDDDELDDFDPPPQPATTSAASARPTTASRRSVWSGIGRRMGKVAPLGRASAEAASDGFALSDAHAGEILPAGLLNSRPDHLTDPVKSAL
jgi:hypothetical protein